MAYGGSARRRPGDGRRDGGLGRVGAAVARGGAALRRPGEGRCSGGLGRGGRKIFQCVDAARPPPCPARGPTRVWWCTLVLLSGPPWGWWPSAGSPVGRRGRGQGTPGGKGTAAWVPGSGGMRSRTDEGLAWSLADGSSRGWIPIWIELGEGGSGAGGGYGRGRWERWR